MTSYFDDGTVTLYLGDMREVLPALGLTVDAIVTDPPYGETPLSWDRWPEGWPTLAATAAASMWCFGSMGMFLNRRDEFAAWKLGPDVVWEKSNGSGPSGADRFRRVHENAVHWYRGRWAQIHHDTPRVAATAEQITRNGRASRTPASIAHRGTYNPSEGWTDNGTRLMRSVIRVKSMRGRALHPTEKPLDILDPLIRYACPSGGLVLDLFAGSGSTLDAARRCGRRAIGIEGDEKYAEAAAKRLSQPALDFGATA
jgi:site-specific DNA-methyltransferase (adenine-specific)